MSDNIAISVKNVSKNFKLPHQKNQSLKSLFTNMLSLGNNTFETQQALKGISFEVKKGEFFGIVGRNGSGKSTLLKILAGIYQPTKGSLKVKGRIVPFIELGVGFNGELSGRENVYLNGALLGFSEKEVDAKYQAIVDFAEIERFMDQKLKNYSSGMQVRLAFSVATVLAESDVLLIDEVLAVGDADFQRKCFNYFKGLKKQDKTVIFVSHDMNAVREYCDRAVLIEKSEIIASGSSDKVATEYTKQFMQKSYQEGGSSSDSNRWGDGAIRYISCSANLSDDKKFLDIVTVAESKKDVIKPIFGFGIKSATGQTLLGTNTKIMKKTVSDLKASKKITITWRVPNIFNDGIYSIDPAIVYDGGLETADWWEGANSFKVLKEFRTPYTINPDIEVDISS